jgi:hypothetical protein
MEDYLKYAEYAQVLIKTIKCFDYEWSYCREYFAELENALDLLAANHFSHDKQRFLIQNALINFRQCSRGLSKLGSFASYDEKYLTEDAEANLDIILESLKTEKSY